MTLRLLRPALRAGLAMTILTPLLLFASEVMEETRTIVVVREHPKTGRPYVAITLPEKEAVDPFASLRKPFSRPDYRLLDPKIKSGAIPYDGPYSDRRKIYIFAASLATLGTAGGIGVIAAAPAATGAAASGGAGAYLAGGTAVVAGSAATAHAVTRTDPRKDDFKYRSESRLVTEEGEDDDSVRV